MKYYLFLILFSFSNSLQSQKLNNNLVLKQCRKEFNKKICLSDEDKDGILFYEDKCPKEKGFTENKGCPWPDQDKDGVIDKDDACPEVAGSSENNGCPWPDTDGDEILDKDDQCPTIPGLVDHYGCPTPFRRDCKAEEQKDSLAIIKLRNDYKDIDQIYNQLNKKIFDSFFKKYKIKDFALYLEFIDWDIHCDLPGCCPNWKYMKYNFLISKFWNRQALESYYDRKNLQYIMFSTKLYPDLIPDFKEFASTSLYTYLIKFYKEDTNRILISKNLNDKNSSLVNVRLYFEDPFKIRVIASCNHSCGNSDIRYEYNGKIWNEITQ